MRRPAPWPGRFRWPPAATGRGCAVSHVSRRCTLARCSSPAAHAVEPDAVAISSPSRSGRTRCAWRQASAAIAPDREVRAAGRVDTTARASGRLLGSSLDPAGARARLSAHAARACARSRGSTSGTPRGCSVVQATPFHHGDPPGAPDRPTVWTRARTRGCRRRASWTASARRTSAAGRIAAVACRGDRRSSVRSRCARWRTRAARRSRAGSWPRRRPLTGTVRGQGAPLALRARAAARRRLGDDPGVPATASRSRPCRDRRGSSAGSPPTRSDRRRSRVRQDGTARSSPRPALARCHEAARSARSDRTQNPRAHESATSRLEGPRGYQSRPARR